MIFDASATGYFISALVFLILGAILIVSWRRSGIGNFLIFAVFCSVVWGAVAGYESLAGPPGSILVAAAELMRNGAWLGFLLILLFKVNPAGWSSIFLRLAAFGGGAVIVTGVVILAAATITTLPTVLGFDARIFANIMLALLGVILVEQLIRNTPTAQRWSIKFLCLGLGVMFAFDLYLYADALLMKHVDLDIWAARGYVNAIVVPLLAVSAGRNPKWDLGIFVSRTFVFHTTTLLMTGAYLMAMAVGGYYVRMYGGTWGGVAQMIFFIGAVVLLIAVLFSGQMRARLRVFMSKNFFNYRYDYREEWLKFINTLSGDKLDPHIKERVIAAIAEIVESPSGLLWLRQHNGEFIMTNSWNMSFASSRAEPEHSSLVVFLKWRQWVVDLDEYRQQPEIYEGLNLPDWLVELESAWLIVPLLERSELRGFVVLTQPRAKMNINWEVRDLLLTTSRQATNYIALLEANEALVDARQFEAFNRLSAYVVHDLKNVVAQLSLVVTNAKRHRDNPAFLEDAVGTVQNAVTKMNKMLVQLRKGSAGPEDSSRIELNGLMKKVVERRVLDKPKPRLVPLESSVFVVTDAERLATVIEHLVQNAQEATPDDGDVTVSLSRNDATVTISIIDNGCGMDEKFIQERLFRPFDTTKGNAGMGIGVYESREFIHSQGGSIEVKTRPGEGTNFRVNLRVADHASHRDDGPVSSVV